MFKQGEEGGYGGHFVMIDDANEFKNMYKEVRGLGCGNFGEVKAMIHLGSGVECAVKIVDKEYLNNQDGLELMKQELITL